MATGSDSGKCFVLFLFITFSLVTGKAEESGNVFAAGVVSKVQGDLADPSDCHQEEASGMQITQVCRAGPAQEEDSLNKWQDGGAVIKVIPEVDLDHGKYVLKVNREKGSSIPLVRANQMAESAASLLLQAEILRDLGEKLRDKSQESIKSIIGKYAALEF